MDWHRKGKRQKLRWCFFFLLARSRKIKEIGSRSLSKRQLRLSIADWIVYLGRAVDHRAGSIECETVVIFRLVRWPASVSIVLDADQYRSGGTMAGVQQRLIVAPIAGSYVVSLAALSMAIPAIAR